MKNREKVLDIPLHMRYDTKACAGFAMPRGKRLAMMREIAA